MSDCLRSLRKSMSRITPALHSDHTKFNLCSRVRIYSALSHAFRGSVDKLAAGFLTKDGRIHIFVVC